MRNRPKHYPYSQSQWEYSCVKLYEGSNPEPCCTLWSKENRITGEKALE